MAAEGVVKSAAEKGLLKRAALIRHAWFFVAAWRPKMAAVSDILGVLSHLGSQNGRSIKVYQIHLVFRFPKWQPYQIHLVFYPILAPQDGRYISIFKNTFCHFEVPR